MSLRFQLPSLADTNPDRPTLHYAADAEAEGASIDTARSVLGVFDPLLRGLLLAGYELESIEVGVGSAQGAAPSVWAVIDLASMEVRASDGVGRVWPSQARLTVAVTVRERTSLTQSSFAIPLSLSGGALGAGATRLEYSTTNPAAGYAALGMALESFGVDADVQTIVEELAARWSDDSGADGLNPFTFTAAPGLLWMLLPQYWYREPTEAPAMRFLHDLATTLAESIGSGGSAEGFFSRQIGANRKNSEIRAASLLGVAESTSRVQAQVFFYSLGQVNGAQGAPIGEDWFYNLAGPEAIGYPSTVRYCEVILHIAEAGLFPFPALVDSDVPSHYDSEDPFEAWALLEGDETIGVGMSVFGSEPLEMLRAVDVGYAAERCFCWEYREPDETGQSALIIVAGPGVLIDGKQNIEGLANCALRIYRVQDVELIPAWGEKIHESLLWGTHAHGRFHWNATAAEDTPADADDPALAPAPDPAQPSHGVAAFRVQQRPDGVRITYPAVASEGEEELILDLRVDAVSPFHRFCFDFQEGEGQMGDRQRQVVRVWATDGVEITVVHDFALGVAVDEHYWRLREPAVPLGGTFDGRTLREMPAPGYPLPVDMPPNRLNPVMLQQGDLNYGRQHLPEVQYWIGVATFVGQLAIEVGIGLTPVGDAVDAAELGASFLTGTDKWGQPVTNFDRALMFGGMMLPFVSSGALRALAGTRGPL